MQCLDRIGKQQRQEASSSASAVVSVVRAVDPLAAIWYFVSGVREKSIHWKVRRSIPHVTRMYQAGGESIH
jgi:hypothetical protein